MSSFLVIWDEKTTACFAFAVELKGRDAWTARGTVQCKALFGHAQIILTIDGEQSFAALAEAVKAIRTKDTVPETRSVGEHHSNGAVERCIRTVTEQFSTMRDHIEAQIGAQIDHRHPVLQTANLITRCSLGEDGRTPHERIKGQTMFQSSSCYSRSCTFPFSSTRMKRE